MLVLFYQFYKKEQKLFDDEYWKILFELKKTRS